MRKSGRQLFAGPYLIWIIGFILLPLAMIIIMRSLPPEELLLLKMWLPSQIPCMSDPSFYP